MRFRTAIALTGLITGLLVGGCSTLNDAWGYKVALENSQRRYTQFIRWGELHRAGEYVHPDAKQAFLSRERELAGLRITDYEIRSFDVNDNRTSATVEVTYHGYSIESAMVRSLHETQEWERDGVQRAWHVRPSLEPATASN